MGYKLGEKIILKVVENKNGDCEGCFFEGGLCTILDCEANYRDDHKDVIFKQITED